MSDHPGVEQNSWAARWHRAWQHLVPQGCPWIVVGVGTLLVIEAAVVAYLAVFLIRYDAEVYGGGSGGGFWTGAAMFLFAGSFLLAAVGRNLTRGRRGWRVVALLVQFIVVAVGSFMHVVREWLDCDTLNTSRCFDAMTSLTIERVLTVGVVVLLFWALYGNASVRRYFSESRRDTR
jgi:hypothetical protein